MKIHWSVMAVRVRLPLSVQYYRLNYFIYESRF
nr:MAG TPA: hypothetical protein [Caudoviricetes sp.]